MEIPGSLLSRDMGAAAGCCCWGVICGGWGAWGRGAATGAPGRLMEMPGGKARPAPGAAADGALVRGGALGRLPGAAAP